MRISIAAAAQCDRQGSRAFDLDALIAECQAAERAGCYAAYTGERRASGTTSYSHNPLLVSSYMLANTERLRVGAGIVVLPLHHPVTVIQDASLVSRLYDGRFRLGLGAGYTTADFEALGVPLSERPRRMEAGLRAIDAYRNGRPHEIEAPYRGSVPRRDEALGTDRLDVMAGGWSVNGVLRAARYTDGWITGPLDTVQALAEMAQIYRAECHALGKTPHVVVLREAWLDETDERAREVYGPFVLSYHQTYLRRGKVYEPRFDPWIDEVSGPDDLTLDHVLPNRVLCGSIETWRRELDVWQEVLAPDELILRLRHVDGPSIAQTLETIERIGAEIIPRYSTTDTDTDSNNNAEERR
jgi:alkanesulfonate monooxygenase SsuD/methylene tetrahydromethanopterin reductase-like flavin-dependent oxidoreductase (luciferase family)